MARTLRWATFLAPTLEPFYRHITETVSRAVSCAQEFEVGRAFSDLVEGNVDIAFVCGLPYVEMTASDPGSVEPLAAPVLVGPRYGGRPVYFSDVIVRADSPHGSMNDLFDCTWAYNEPHSHSGYNITRFQLAQIGHPSGFRHVLRAGWHEHSIDLVLDGTVDAAPIDSHVLELARHRNPRRTDRLRVIESFGPSTIQPVVASANLPETLRRDLQEAIVGSTECEQSADFFRSMLIEELVSVVDSDYDDIRRMLARADSAGATLGPEINAIPADVPASVSLPKR
jgi:phosphonate transport system substrate-binding protein